MKQINKFSPETIEEILATSLKERYIFHSEADFQHHLAWCIHAWCIRAKVSPVKLRLEYPLSTDPRKYCDIVLKSPCNIGIELKYKTKELTKNIEDECFELTDQGAHDIGRYGFLKDIQRLETWCNKGKIECGYAIMLTNDKNYWAPKKQNDDTNDKNFKLYPNRKITGILEWHEKTSPGTKEDNEKAIKLENQYMIDWKDVDGCSGFKYMFLQIKR